MTQSPATLKQDEITNKLKILVEISCLQPSPESNQKILLDKIHDLSNCFFSIPDWITLDKPWRIDWFELFSQKRDIFDNLREKPDTYNLNAVYWKVDLNENNTKNLLNPDGEFMQNMQLVASLLCNMIENNRYLVLIKPEHFLFYENRIEGNWNMLEEDLLTNNKKTFERMQVGWMHNELRNRELPSSPDGVSVLVTHAFAYMMLYTLTRMPPASNQGALIEQIDRFRLYNPGLPAELRTVWREFLQMKLTENKTPLDFINTFLSIIRSILEYKSETHDSITYDIGGDSRYGRQKRGYNNEDVFFYTQKSGNSVLLAVADGVSTAQLGTGGLASGTIKQRFEETKEFWRSELEKLTLNQDWDKQSEVVLDEFINKSHEAVLEEINRCYSRNPEKAKGIESNQTMSSTLVVAIVTGTRVKIAHLGDSRAYKIGKNVCIRLTEDHNRRNEHIRPSGGENDVYDPVEGGAELTRVIGQCDNDKKKKCCVGKELQIQYDTTQLSAEEILLLCTDGLLNIEDPRDEEKAEETLMERIDLTKMSRDIAHHIVCLADQNHGVDNITALILKISVDDMNQN